MKTFHSIALIVISGLLISCGGSTFSKKPTIKKRGAQAGDAGARFGFEQVVAQADTIKGEEAGDRFARLILKTQFELMNVNDSDLKLSSSGETGHCMVLASEAKFSESDISSSIKLSKNGHVAYSESDTMKASECQVFFQEEIPGKLMKEFFDMHISFFSLTF